jgi:hypothetical protein
MLYDDGITKIYKVKYNDNDFLKNLILHKVIENNTKDNLNSEFIIGGSCSFFNKDNSGRNLYLWDELSSYLDFIRPHVNNYIKSINMNEDDYCVTAMWSNNYPPGTYVQRHRHTYIFENSLPKFYSQNDMIAVILYLEKPENSGNLILEIPQDNSYFDYEVEMDEGD